jgi:hypothetical protein
LLKWQAKKDTEEISMRWNVTNMQNNSRQCEEIMVDEENA